MKTQASRLALACALSVLAVVAHAGTVQTKDIVLDRVRIRTVASAPLATPASNAVATTMQTTAYANGDAMVVTVLQQKADGTLVPRPTNAVFRTGNRFRVKMLASRDGKVALYNTKPTGELVTEPLWRGDVSKGLEIITPALRLEANKGTEQLHIVLEPVQETGVIAWLGSWLKTSPKDIRLDVQNTRSDTYLLGLEGKGLLTTLFITHK
ncbi:MAG: hypothetical protein V4772_21335 [Pseudomonadota bacterium]